MLADSRNIEFEAAVDSEGKIVLPPFALEKFPRGDTVRVRLTGVAFSAMLRKRGVTEEEIDRIAGLQMESREQVVKFLMSEGALGRTGLVPRGKKR